MSGLRARAVRVVLVVLAVAALAACGSSSPAPIQAGPGNGQQSGQHTGHHNKRKHGGKHHHKHNSEQHATHHHGGGNGGSGNGGGSATGGSHHSGGGNGGGSGNGGGGNGGGGNAGGGGHHGGGHHHGGGNGGGHSSSPPPPPANSPSVTVTPSSGLNNAQSVHVVGSNFKPNEQLVVIECVDHGNSTGPSDCNVPHAKFTKSGASGGIDQMLQVYAKVKGQTCGSPLPCIVSVAPPSQTNHADEADENISFA
jgi:hypothetical protein